MNNNLVTRVLYRTVCCTVSFFGILFMTEFFSLTGTDTAHFTGDLFYFYTNLSNFLCFGVWLACLTVDVRQLRRGRTCAAPCTPFLRFLKLAATMIIAITFLAYGMLLGEPTKLRFWNNIANLCYHVFCPVLFLVDGIAFDEHKTIGILDPVLAAVLPIFYVVVIEIMGAFTGRYPYFFLDMSALGFGGLMMWIGILLGLFLVIGYLLFLWDKVVRKNGKWKLDFAETRLVSSKQRTAP